MLFQITLNLTYNNKLKEKKNKKMSRNLQEIRAQMKRLVEEANFQYKVLTPELQKNIIEAYYNIIINNDEYDSNKWDPVDFYDDPDSVDLFLEMFEYSDLDWRNVLPKDIVDILDIYHYSNMLITDKDSDIDYYIKKENEDRRLFNSLAPILEDPEIIERLKQYTFQLRKEIEKFMKEKAKNGEIEIEKRPY